MAVYTPISLSEVRDIFEERGLLQRFGEPVSIQEIQEGTNNSVFNIRTRNEQDLIVIIHENHDARPQFAQEVEFYLQYAKHLRQQGVPTIEPIALDSQNIAIDYKGKPLSLCYRLSGKTLREAPETISAQQCYAVGWQLAHMHDAGMDHATPPASPQSLTLSPAGWFAGLKKFSESPSAELDTLLIQSAAEVPNSTRHYFTPEQAERLRSEFPSFIGKLGSQIEQKEQSWKKQSVALPRTIIHGDAFPENTMWDEKRQFTGFIDLWTARQGPAVYDLATSLIPWTLEHNGKTWTINREKFTSMLQGYAEHRKVLGHPMTRQEYQCLPEMMEVSCLRFTCSRLSRILDASKASVGFCKLNPYECSEKIEAITHSLPELTHDIGRVFLSQNPSLANLMPGTNLTGWTAVGV